MYFRQKGGKMARKYKSTKKIFDPIADAINKEFLYAKLLPLALQTINHGFRYKDNEATYIKEYEKLEKIKSSLSSTLLSSTPKNSAIYQKRFATKMLLEKLILDICSNNRSEIKNDLAKIILHEGLSIVEKYQPPISKAEKLLIRSDFDGNIFSQKATFFSKTYKNLQNRKPESKSLKQKYSPASYNLYENKSWQIYAQFANFRKLEPKLKQALAKLKIPTSAAKNLNPFDIADIIRNHCKKEHSYLFESSRSKFVKYFIRHHENDFKDYMYSHQPIISEILQKKGITLPYNSPETYVSYVEGIIDKMRKNGNLPTMFNVHHKVAVQDGKQKNSLSEVNDPRNLCLILDCPYHSIIHEIGNKNNHQELNIYNLSKKVEIGNDIIFFGGLDKISQIKHNFPKQRAKTINLPYLGKER